MDETTAKLFLKNVISRLRPDPAAPESYCLGGVLTALELEAMELLAGAAKEAPVVVRGPRQPALPGINGSTLKVEGPPAPQVASKRLPLDLSSLDEKNSDYVLMCLDFGTAFSKASLMAVSNTLPVSEELHVLPLGKNSPLVASSIYLDSSGTDRRIWFGDTAVEKSLQEDAPGRGRFDSPKQHISQGDISALHARSAGDHVDPTKSFTVGGLVQLYLGYLTYLAEREATKVSGGRRAGVRYARPCWGANILGGAREALARMLVAGRILADTVGDQWEAGLPVATAVELLSDLKKTNPGRGQLIVGDVSEATAAAAGALSSTTQSRELFLIVDVGAGTSDFGLYFLAQTKREGQRLAAYKNSIHAIRQAGDTVDQILMKAILEGAHLSPGDQEAVLLRPTLARLIRADKEVLFRTGRLDKSLSNDTVVPIDLKTFISRPDIAAFAQNFSAAVRTSLEGATRADFERFDFRVKVVALGGGATLPMVKSNLQGPVTLKDGTTVHLDLVDAVPEWLAQRYPQVVPVFPQLAVAIGGAQFELPEELAEVSSIPLMRDQGFFIPAAQRGS